MADIIYVTVTVAFFALAAGFVRVCDRIIGPDPAPTSEPAGTDRPIETGDIEPASAAGAK